MNAKFDMSGNAYRPTDVQEGQVLAYVQVLGEEGERLRDLAVTQESARVIGNSQWGETVLIKFRDEQDNVYCWFTGSGSGLQQGEKAVIDGTVKKHNEYQGAKETQLTRVKVKELAA